MSGDEKLVAFLKGEADQIVHDLAHHVGDQIYELLKRNGMMMRSEAAATSMLTLAAVHVFGQAVDQCSRAAEDDCTAAVAQLFVESLPKALAAYVKFCA